MAFVHPNSCECAKSELDLFTTPPTQTSIEGGVWTEYHPISSLDREGPIEFNISGSGDDYIDLTQTQLYVKAKIVRHDGAVCGDTDNVGPVNLLLQSLFSQVDISLNDKLVSQSSNTYAYRAYLETLLNYGVSASSSHLTTALWYKDTAAHMDANDITGDNAGLEERSEYTKESKTVDLIGRIHSDIFFQEKYLVSGVNVRIRFVRSSNAFVLMSNMANAAFRVEILNASLHMRKIKLSSSIQLAHAKALEISSMKYPVIRAQVKTFSIPAGNLNTCQENLFLGQLPKRIIVGCVDNDAFNGSYVKNPFNFKNFALNYMAVHIDGQQDVIKPIQPNFTTGHYIRSFSNFFMGIGKLHKDQGIIIDRADYLNGYTLYAFDLSPDMSSGGNFNLIRTGSVRLDMKFATALPNTINVVVYAEFENIIEINRDRNILCDFTL